MAEGGLQVEKQSAQGSSWNANSYHFEERDYSTWGKKRLNELLDERETKEAGVVVLHQGQEFTLDLKLEMKKLEGDAWVNIRKGKKMTCFNYELDLAFKGHILGGTDNRWDLEGKFFYEVAVGDDPETRFELKQRYPFQKAIEASLSDFVTAQFKIFVTELGEKGQPQVKDDFATKVEPRVQKGQYVKYEQGPDGVAALQETAKKYSDKMNSNANQTGKPSKHLHCEHSTH